MRDDNIRISGPFEVLPLDVPEREDEDDDGNPIIVPAHTLGMSHMRRFELECRTCGCGRIHGYSIIIRWDDMLNMPELAEWTLDAGFDGLKRTIEDCGVSA